MTDWVKRNRDDIWHAVYSRWYDHLAAGHRIRTAAWGWIADRLVQVMWSR